MGQGEAALNQSPVIIAGGGPVGIGLALELALHGHRPIVLERRQSGEVWQCRSNLTNARSMELFRRWGIADQLRKNDPVGDHVARSVTWVTGLEGHIVADFVNAFQFDEPIPISSETPEWAPNAGIEKTVHDAAIASPMIDIRFGAEVTTLAQDDAGVDVTYTDADGTHSIRGSYLVGADGSRSFVRQQLGVRLEGHADLVAASIWLVEAPGLAKRATVGESSFYFFINEHRDSLFLIRQDDEDRYMLGIVPASEGMDPDSWEDTLTVLYRNLGFELPVKNLSGGRVRIHSLIAARFDHGRVLLAGDAAHLISPMGGFGMNIGVGDSMDLGWKLGAVLNGWGGPKLLESYGLERSFAEKWIQEECIDNTGTLAPQLVEDGISDDGPDGDAIRARVGARIFEVKSKEFSSIGAQLGYRYDESPIVVADGSPPPPLSMAEYTPCARPGALAPHVWLADGDSLYDHFGLGFTLIKLDSEADSSVLEAAASARGVPLEVFAPVADGLAELYEAKLAIVRPDHHVAWRGDSLPSDPEALLDTIRGA